MVLVNLELLSTEELRNLSEQERIDGWETLEREDLILALVEKYEEEVLDSGLDKGGNINIKYMASFSDYKVSSDHIRQLPGVEELPEYYEETSIHLLSKNSDWGYAFWSISALDREKMEEKGGVPLLVVTIRHNDGTSESYDIPVGENDREWNIGFTYDRKEAYVSLAVDYSNGRRDFLATSRTLSLSRSYWLEHTDEMKENDTLFKVYLSLITTKMGEVIRNPITGEIISRYSKGGAR